MDEITTKIYQFVLEYFKNQSEESKTSLKNIFGFNIESNLFRLDSIFSEIFENQNLQQYPMEWFSQWLPYATKDTQDWYNGWIAYQDAKNLGEKNTDAWTYENAEYPLKQNLLLACKPIKDKITQMCMDKTLYEPE
jgi:hypothetical protein